MNAILIAAAAVVGISLLGFWIWMLVECVTKEPKEGNDRLVWLVVIVATKVVGAAVYYFVRRPERMRLEAE